MAAGIVIVQQHERMVIQRFGRFDKVVGPGFRFLVPIIFNGTKVGIWERTERVPTQKVHHHRQRGSRFGLRNLLTRCFPTRTTLASPFWTCRSFEVAVVNLAVAELRSIIGNITLAEALAERERIQGRLQMALGREHRPVGREGAQRSHQRN